MSEKNYTLVLEGPTESDEDDLEYQLVPVETITGPDNIPQIPDDYIEKVVNFCDADDDDEWECYEDVKKLEKAGEPVDHSDYVLLNTVSLFGEPFAAILKKDESHWKVVALEAGDFLNAEDIEGLPAAEKGTKIQEKLLSLLDNVEDYSTVHLVKPWREGRPYPFKLE